jgi:hypothetical protein
MYGSRNLGMEGTRRGRERKIFERGASEGRVQEE